ncbi:serine/threonine-protein kinase [Pendulispora albinea]|uniref:non-specific serine/threonine protein kinase n=1 Tax=Pendulispora albinea TaxID=2741071 RepID=A0ABZ2MBQ7_9BACT
MLFPNEGQPSAIGGFEVLERLGSGGAGQVYLARSKGGRLVAVKVLSDNTKQKAESETLAREASLCVRLSHPAIVQVRALVEEGGVAALVFDYVEGVALGRLLRFLSTRGERLADLAGWHIMERVLSALDYAHHQTPPIVHRDVSPSNVLLDWTGDAKLTDFGMAKMLGVASTTQLGLVKGTLGCMSPEQARGDPVTERADVYAAALLAWRLATGFAPFAKYRNDEVEMLRAMKNPRLAPLSALRPDLPERLADAVAAALAPDPEARTLSAEEFRRAIRENIDTEPGRQELRAVLQAAREDLARTNGAAAGSGGVSMRSKTSSKGRMVTSRYGEALAQRDGGDGDGDEGEREGALALRPFSPESVPPVTGATPALPASLGARGGEGAFDGEGRREEADRALRSSFPPASGATGALRLSGMSRVSRTSLTSVAASQSATSRLSLGMLGIPGRRRPSRSHVVVTLLFVAFIFFVAGLALGLAMHR